MKLAWMSMDGDFVCENQDYVDFQDCDDACVSFSPSPLIPLPSRERGIWLCVVILTVQRILP